MRSVRFVWVLLSGAALAALSCDTASASVLLTTNYSFILPSQTANWSSSIGLQRFPHAKGTLVSVTVNLFAGLNGSLQVANTKTFNNVITTKSATPSPTGYTGNAHVTHCTTSSASCTVWNITYTSAPPAKIPTVTVDSNLSAQVTLQLGANSVSTTPSVGETDKLAEGPAHNPTTYTFVKQYSGTAITKPLAMAKTVSGTGIVQPGVVPSPAGLSVSDPCNDVFGTCTVGTAKYHTGATHTNLWAFDATTVVYTQPTDLSFFYGKKIVNVPIIALDTSSQDGGADIALLSDAEVFAIPNISYTYIPSPEPITFSLFAAGLAFAGARRAKRKQR